MTWQEAVAALRAAGLDEPVREARRLWALASGPTASVAGPRPADPVPPGMASLVARRAAREPMARIAGRQGFWTLDLAVSEATLIPRADTETLVEAALAVLADDAPARILDLGTGTGAILLAVLSERPLAWGVGVDLAAAACRVARDNAASHGLASRAAFVCGDWDAALAGRFDLVLANPPYIASDDIAALMPEVACHEPRLALDGGPDGLGAYRNIIPRLPRLLAEGGAAVLELGCGQDAAVSALAMTSGLVVEAAKPDLGGIARALVMRRSPEAPAADSGLASGARVAM